MFYLILSNYVLTDSEKEFITVRGGFYDVLSSSIIIYSTDSSLILDFILEYSIEGGVSNV